MGSGAAGSWAAKCLTEAGLNVALVEAGAELPPGDFIASATPDEMAARQIQARCSAFNKHTALLFVNDVQNPYWTPPDAPFNWFRGNQVGGRLITWARHVPRMGENAFSPEGTVEGRAWPIEYRDLVPHYARVERRLAVSGRADGLLCCPDGEFSGIQELSPLAESICRRLLNFDETLPVTPGRLVRYDARRTPLPLLDALSTERLTLFPETRAINVSASSTSKGVQVQATKFRSGGYEEFSARIVLLAASSFETVRLLLGSELCKTHHLNHSGCLGHYIADHVFCTTGGQLSPQQAAEASANGRRDASPWDFGHTTLYLPGLAPDDGRIVGNFGVQLVIAPGGAPTWSAAAFGEMLPDFRNHIEISEDMQDARNGPGIFIECRHGENEIAMTSEILKRLSLIALAAGLEEMPQDRADLERFLPHGAYVPGASIHEVGGARMGTSMHNSVVNSYGQCWSCPNVFVIDGACFPSLPFQNPTLTIMAIADRACSYISENRKFFGIS